MMPKAISPAVDTLIMLSSSTGLTNKEIAAKYGVSTSYVSKLLSGKKTPAIKAVEPTTIKDGDLHIEGEDIQKLEGVLHSMGIIQTEDDIITILRGKVRHHLIQAKLYQILLDKLKQGDN